MENNDKRLKTFNEKKIEWKIRRIVEEKRRKGKKKEEKGRG